MPPPCVTLHRRDLLAERLHGTTDDVHFTEALAEHVISAYSRPGELVLDPFAGFGTTARVAVRMGRRAIAVELLPERAQLIRLQIGDAARVISGDARALVTLVGDTVDLCLTSPPYMTRSGHPANPLTGYQTLDAEYVTYLDELESVWRQVSQLLRPGGHLVVNAATLSVAGEITPLAADIGDRISRHLVRLEDLPICWDEAPPSIVDDRCLIFRKPRA
jgi:DNA modification methylase